MVSNAEPPFEEYRLYGPTFHKGEGRNYIFLVVDSKNRTTISYARYLMSVHLGRVLKKNEHVDHIDNDKTNDVIENLQILSPDENTKKSGTGEMMVILKCPWCMETFEKRRGKTFLSKGGTYSACSRSCSGKFANTANMEKKKKGIAENVIMEYRETAHSDL